MIPGRLMAGLFPGEKNPEETARRMAALLRCGIRRVINLMEPDERNYDGELFAPYLETMQQLAGPDQAVSMKRFPIPDGSIPSRATMRAILDAIDEGVNAGEGVYVHCWGGKGRTGTVIGCYLVRHGLAAPEEALQRITDLRRAIRPVQPSPETPEQYAFVRAWKKGN